MSYDFGTYGFTFLKDIEHPVIQLTGIGIEKRTSMDYYYDNYDRDIDSFLFQYTLKGAGVLEIDDKKYVLKEGHGFFIKIPSNTKYYFSEDNNIKEWEYIFFLYRSEFTEEYYRKVINESGNIFSLPLDSLAIQNLFDMYRQVCEGRVTSFLSANALAFEFLSKLCISVTENTSDYTSRSKEVIQIIENDFSTLQGISHIAGRLSISQCHLTREFKKDVGISPLEYLTNIRIRHSIHLLYNTELSVNEIALLCGFSCGNYFSKVFQKQMYISPANYRKNLRLELVSPTLI